MAEVLGVASAWDPFACDDAVAGVVAAVAGAEVDRMGALGMALVKGCQRVRNVSPLGPDEVLVAAGPTSEVGDDAGAWEAVGGGEFGAVA